MIRKFAYAVAFIFLLVSCNIENGHDEYMGDIIVPESDGSYWIEEIDVENPEDEIPLDNIQSGMMYGAYSADTLSTRSSDSSINRNNTTGSFSLLPGGDGRIRLKPSDLGLSAGEKLLAYQLRKHELTKDKDLYFDYTKEPLFYVYDHRERRYMKIFEEFYRIDFSKPEEYGITDISKVAIFDIRLATRGVEDGQLQNLNRTSRFPSPSMQSMISETRESSITFSVRKSILTQMAGGEHA